MTFLGDAQIIRADGCKKCSQCGLAKPLAAFARASKEKSGYKSACKACIKIESAKYYVQNKAKIDARNKAYGKANPDVMNAGSARYRERHPEQHLSAVLSWQARNPDKKIIISARWYEANKEKCKARTAAWFAAHPDARKQYDAHRYVLVGNAKGTFTQADRETLFAKQHGKCAGCECEIDQSAHADHVVALSRGGSNDISNRQLLCRVCNSRKNTKPNEQFLRLMRSGAYTGDTSWQANI